MAEKIDIPTEGTEDDVKVISKRQYILSLCAIFGAVITMIIGIIIMAVWQEEGEDAVPVLAIVLMLTGIVLLIVLLVLLSKKIMLYTATRQVEKNAEKLKKAAVMSFPVYFNKSYIANSLLENGFKQEQEIFYKRANPWLDYSLTLIYFARSLDCEAEIQRLTELIDASETVSNLKAMRFQYFCLFDGEGVSDITTTVEEYVPMINLMPVITQPSFPVVIPLFYNNGRLHYLDTRINQNLRLVLNFVKNKLPVLLGGQQEGKS